MNKFALAALGAVAARKHQGGLDFGFDHKTHIMDDIEDFMFGEEPKPACYLNEGDRMEDFVFGREAIKAVINAGVKGLYHETTEAQPVSEDCFGDWIDSELDEVNDTVMKIYDDFWSFTFADATGVANKLISMHYKNMEACDFERIQDDKQTWCLANPEKCVGLEGLFENLWANSPSVISKASDLYDLATVDDTCYSDVEVISEIARATEDIASIVSTAWGFDLKWDQSRQVSHIKRRDFKNQIRSMNIDFGEYIEIPTMDDIFAVIEQNISIYDIYQGLKEALHYIGLDF